MKNGYTTLPSLAPEITLPSGFPPHQQTEKICKDFHDKQISTAYEAIASIISLNLILDKLK